PTTAGLTNVDGSTLQFVITGNYSVDGAELVKFKPIYVDAPATTAALNLASLVGVTSAPVTFMGAAIAQITAAGAASVAPAIAAKDAAIVAKDQAVAAKTEMEAILVTDLATTDGQSAALINTEASATRGALNSAIATATGMVSPTGFTQAHVEAAVDALPLDGGHLHFNGAGPYVLTAGLHFNGYSNLTITSDGAQIIAAASWVDTKYDFSPTDGQDSLFRFL